MSHPDDPHVVRYGVPLKLRHVKTQQVLHSHALLYHSGSRLQEVTCFGNRDDNDWWIVKGPHGEGRYNCHIGTPVLNGAVVRLEHMLTEKNLHADEAFKSPETHQGEVCGFGEHGIGNNKDDWVVEVLNAQPGAPWRIDHQLRFVHTVTHHSLHSHHGHHTHSHQQEVTAYNHRDDNDLWQIEINT